MGRNPIKTAHERVFFLRDVKCGRDVLFGYYEHVNRSLRRDVLEGKGQFVLVEDLRRGLLPCYPAKYAPGPI